MCSSCNRNRAPRLRDHDSRKEMRNVTQQVRTKERDAVLVEEGELIRMMGIGVLEAVPSRGAPYELTDPFILVHEGRFRPSELAGKNTRHPHRGFDNIWYVLQGSASTGHSTGPEGSTQRAHLDEGSLLFLRTGRGVWHAAGGSEKGPEKS